jgi:hypothetical protein
MSDEVVACVRALQGISRQEVLRVLPLVLSFCLAEGILTESELQPIVANVITQIPASESLAGIPLAELFAMTRPSRADEIDALYSTAHSLAEAAREDPSQQILYQACLAKLRALQEMEADEMAAIAESRRHLPRGAFDAEMIRVKALLGDV